MSKQKKLKIKSIETPKPDRKDNKIYNDLEIELLLQLSKSISGKRFMEAYFLSWTIIEQFMLPKLIQFTAHNLSVVIPKGTERKNINQVISLYYFLSHDHKLYLALEKARKKRNDYVHKIYNQDNWSAIKNGYKTSLKGEIREVLQLFSSRFKGETKIPSLSLYSKGWNDCREKILQNFDKLEEIAKS